MNFPQFRELPDPAPHRRFGEVGLGPPTTTKSHRQRLPFHLDGNALRSKRRSCKSPTSSRPWCKTAPTAPASPSRRCSFIGDLVSQAASTPIFRRPRSRPATPSTSPATPRHHLRRQPRPESARTGETTTKRHFSCGEVEIYDGKAGLDKIPIFTNLKRPVRKNEAVKNQRIHKNHSKTRAVTCACADGVLFAS